MTATLTYVSGDLFKREPVDHTQIIAHVCNDQGKMGSGFVLPLAAAHPKSREAYKSWSEAKPSPDGVRVFGNDSVFQMGRTQFVQVDDKLVVANMVAQTLGGSRPLYYNQLARCMDQVATVAILDSAAPDEIICPMFGSGLAAGNWEFIQELIYDCWLRRGINVTCYYLPQFLDGSFIPPTESHG